MFILIVFGGGAYFVMHQKQSPQTVPQNSDNASASNAPTPSSEKPVFQPLDVGQTILSAAKTAGYTRDTTGIYIMDLNGRAGKVTGADLNSFEVNIAWPIYARDNAHVYIYGEIISAADPKTFVAMCGFEIQLESFCAYGKDSKHVYAYAQVIPDADPATFVSLKSNNEANKNNSKMWIDSAIDASAYYSGYVPSVYGNFNSKLEGVRISKLDDGTPVYFSDTSKVIARTYLIDGVAQYRANASCDAYTLGKKTNCTWTLSRAGVRTYINSQFGYSVLYSSDNDTSYSVDKSGKSSTGSVGFTVSGVVVGDTSGELVIHPPTPIPLNYQKTKACETLPQPHPGKSYVDVGNITINGVSFYTYTEPTFALTPTVSDTNKSYLASHNGNCYYLQENIESSPGGDTAQVSAKLEAIVRSFRFTQ